MLVHTKGKQVRIYANYSLIQSFMRLNHLLTFLLKSRKTYQKRKNIRCHNFALGQTNEQAFLTRPDSDLCGQVVKAQDNNSTSISVRRLDEFCLVEHISAIDLLKIDVEGNELSVLKGTSGMIERNAIRAIFLECDFNKEDKQHSYFFDIFDFLSEEDFVFTDFLMLCDIVLVMALVSVMHYFFESFAIFINLIQTYIFAARSDYNFISKTLPSLLEMCKEL